MMLRLRFTRRASAVKHVCLQCESRRALFRYRGVVKWDRYHALCFRCYRRHLDRLRAARLVAEIPAPADPVRQKEAAVA
ncbi:MAG: hypothetical protein IT180_07380 [Acidobacteria bacterium]|nr:hypothetical protein [Acidobacteriota bacterium]HQZ39827.1 hypothetical protein [Vicinamibacterales bacterium]